MNEWNGGGGDRERGWGQGRVKLRFLINGYANSNPFHQSLKFQID